MAKARVLAAAMHHVDAAGFTSTAVQRGCEDCGLLALSQKLFRDPAASLIQHFGQEQRSQLEERFASDRGNASYSHLLRVCRARLDGTVRYAPHWSGALAVLARPSNAPAAAQGLAGLTTVMLQISGFPVTITSPSSMGRHAALASAYASSELLLATSETGPAYEDVYAFLAARISDIERLDNAATDAAEYTSFAVRGLANVLRSKGVRV